MPQSLALVLVHIIFSTKNRMAFLQSPELRWEVHAYLTGTLRALESEPLQVTKVGQKELLGQFLDAGAFMV